MANVQWFIWKNYVPVLSLRLIVTPRNHSTVVSVVPDLVHAIHWYVLDNPELIQNCKKMIKKTLTHTLRCLYAWTYQNGEFALELRLTWRSSWPTGEFNACSRIQIFCSGPGIVHDLKLILLNSPFFLMIKHLSPGLTCSLTKLSWPAKDS